MRRLFIVALLCILLAGCGGSPTTTTPAAPAAGSAPTAAPADVPTAEAPTAAPEVTAEAPTAAPADAGPGKVGDRIEGGGTALTIVEVKKADKIGDFQEAKDGNTFVITEVLIEATQDKTDYNPFYFKVKDSEGFEANATIDTGGQGLKSGVLAKGEKARGSVVFEVKKGAKGLVLSYQPIALAVSGESLKVTIPD